uniref:Uncharacterized protein n=1 Tax=Arundo donax TaxID=35708 RepID=A0A0A9EIK9_ARUDO
MLSKLPRYLQCHYLTKLASSCAARLP